MSKSVLPVFSSKSFRVCGLTFRTLIHFEFIFVYGVNFVYSPKSPWWSDHKESACNPGDPWIRSLGQEDSMEKGMATHSSILAWRIPWTEEPGGLQSKRSQRVGQD